jgi:hypothetical protein
MVVSPEFDYHRGGERLNACTSSIVTTARMPLFIVESEWLLSAAAHLFILADRYGSHWRMSGVALWP